MQVAMDVRMWDHPGIGRYIREIISAISAHPKCPDMKLLGYGRCRAAILGVMPQAHFVTADSPIYSIREQAELSRFSESAPLLHVPHFNIPWSCKARLVVTVHDLIYLKSTAYSGSFAGKWYVRSLLGRIASRARAVIAVSEFTRKDLIESYPALRARTRVIYEAASERFRAKITRDPAATPYLLFVGSLKSHKNVGVLLDAFALLKREVAFKGLELVLAGRRDPKERDLNRRVEEAAAQGVRVLGEVRDDELPRLYAQAQALVLPSLWEGFGLPALEAMTAGTAVVLSDRASLPEIGGDAAAYFPADRPEALVARLRSILSDPIQRQAMIERGHKQASLFSWARAADETIRVYEEALA